MDNGGHTAAIPVSVGGMDAVEALTQLGGTADVRVLRQLASRRAVRRALTAGLVVRPRLGTYALPVLDETEAALRATGGVRSHLSAALHHGWAVKTAPDLPMIKVTRNQHVDAERRDGIRLCWRQVGPDERAAGVTDPVQTVVDCARDLPFDEALAVADSALRSGLVERDQLLEAAARSPRTGRSRALRIVEAADGRAANPFESVLRAISREVPGLELVPQVTLGVAAPEGGLLVIGRVDLVDATLGIVVEAESWEFHGSRAAFDRDVRRYTAMVRAGWTVVRFVWHEVMHDPDLVFAVLTDVVALATGASAPRLVRADRS